MNDETSVPAPMACPEDVTMLDYFAALALQGICASGPDRSWTSRGLAQEAYKLASAMAEVRKEYVE